ncbi:hypothetical protein FH972_018499 [Carpinus fangiana]|uniref:Uncharacterized protein n=1 Tax=Carpinus fangiana TaxID=176857 RepID=A0A5N6RQI7_9ROSI|nr:hypothetical protein FH972_018499 [Carpinus fangiana]
MPHRVVLPRWHMSVMRLYVTFHHPYARSMAVFTGLLGINFGAWSVRVGELSALFQGFRFPIRLPWCSLDLVADRYAVSLGLRAGFPFN